ncbi:FAD-dependent monooxygenase [Aurantimonas sp. Leaf443]|uniref:FAD-dependent monooxygenase n=1 Tax=Aurantimonas sp. Leaf443 TaxID=1736378 RepID=UPI0006F8652D|nr:FAD-dependent monooxygenase [Aurantimonas sp. Leaf443]KQT86296.1 hypothetical protein ASG48_06990 [Aurantimonas sp. Leaf443]
MTPETPIAVVGAGIAGLALALALEKRGRAVRLFEAAPALSALGAGLQLSPNALRVVDALGLLPELEALASRAHAVTLRRASDDRAIARVPVISTDGTPYLSLHRADLQRVLLRAVERRPRIDLHLGHRLEAVRPRPDGIALTFSCGTDARVTVEAGLAVGADGVHSALASAAGLQDAAPTGRTAWRAMVEARSQGDGAPGITAWLAANRHVVAYPVSGGMRTNVVAILPSAAREDRSGGPAFPKSKTAPRLADLLARADGWTPWPILQTPAQRPYRLCEDRAVLIGDAGHAMAPFAAQGAALALEDAAVLADCLVSEASPAEALARYEAARRPRIDAVRRRVAFHRRVYHLPAPLSLARDAALALRAPASLAADLAWLYDWAPPLR